ncbi:unnamed protein product [Linum trigynum]|uniref:Uncharacterized protein n=1 Tax=Linum trigynum TaxID=586398 RepID=A0AAV2CCS9_9ROSI
MKNWSSGRPRTKGVKLVRKLPFDCFAGSLLVLQEREFKPEFCVLFSVDFYLNCYLFCSDKAEYSLHQLYRRRRRGIGHEEESTESPGYERVMTSRGFSSEAGEARPEPKLVAKEKSSSSATGNSCYSTMEQSMREREWDEESGDHSKPTISVEPIPSTPGTSSVASMEEDIPENPKPMLPKSPLFMDKYGDEDPL